MVAISLYRGNLHRVPDVPRRWLMPSPAITLRDFRRLLLRRSRSLSRLDPPAPALPRDVAAECSEPPRAEEAERGGSAGDGGCAKPAPLEEAAGNDPDKGPVAQVGAKRRKEDEADKEAEDGGNRAGVVKCSDPASTSNIEEGIRGAVDGGDGVYNLVANIGDTGKIEAKSSYTLSDVEERKMDIEKKLDILNEKKHHLVQMLKQILKAEDEIKKKISVQPPPVQGPHASTPVQTDGTNDTSSVTRVALPRMNVEVNFSSDVGTGGESEEIVSHHSQQGHSQQVYSTSPSTISAFNRSTHGFIRHNPVGTPRAASTSAGPGSTTPSPSRFAPAPGHPGLPPVSISGTHYFASSPSPAASGGTSSFRDSRLTSP